MKLPKFIRYLKCRSRLVRFTVACDIAEKERILNSYLSMAFRKYPELFNTSYGSYIRFSVGVSYYERSAKFKEFEKNATTLCKRLGYRLLAGWGSSSSGKCDDKKGYYFYSVHPASEISNVKGQLDHRYIFSQPSYVEVYYDKIKKIQNMVED